MLIQVLTNCYTFSYLKQISIFIEDSHLINTAIDVIAAKGVNVDIAFALYNSWENGRKRLL